MTVTMVLCKQLAAASHHNLSLPWDSELETSGLGIEDLTGFGMEHPRKKGTLVESRCTCFSGVYFTLLSWKFSSCRCPVKKCGGRLGGNHCLPHDGMKRR